MTSILVCPRFFKSHPALKKVRIMRLYSAASNDHPKTYGVNLIKTDNET
jgi:hypothetical protein